MSRPARQYDLDLFRFLAAVAVVLYHFTFRGFAGDDELMVTTFETTGLVTRYGYLGVNFFFMISGYVILMSAKGRSLREFAISRVARLYPAFWAALLMTTAVQVLWGGSKFAVGTRQFFTNLTMAPNVFGDTEIDSAYWSLLVELKFYAIIGVLIIAGLMTTVKRIEVVLAGWTAAMVAVGIFNPGGRLVDFALFPRYASYFIAGALFYLVKTHGLSVARVGLLAINFVLSVRWSRIEARRLGDIFSVEYDMVVTVGLVTLFFALFGLVALNLTGKLQRPEFLSLGALTYALYLVHQHIGYIMLNRLDGVVPRWVALTGVLVAMVALAKFVSAVIEIPAGRVLRTWLTARLVPQPAPVVPIASANALDEAA